MPSRKKTTKKNLLPAHDGSGTALALASASHALSPLAPNPQTDDNGPGTISTDIALASDGHLYVSDEFFTPEERKGRKRFVGYRLTRREQAAATKEALSMAFNLVIPVRQAMREERAKPKRLRK